MLSALSILGVMASYKKNLFLNSSVWFFWVIAITAHSYSLLPIFNGSLSVNLSINYALNLVAFIISITLFISAIIGNTKFLGIVTLPIISLIFLFDFSNNPVSIPLDNFLFVHVIISLISYSILCLSAAQSIILKLQEKNYKPTNQLE